MTDFFSRKNNDKPTKAEAVESNFEEVVTDPMGVEQTFANGLFGRAEIDLDKLSISPKLGMATNNIKVNLIKKSMLARYDPTLCLMVCPENDATFDAVNLESNYYHVIHISHRLKALIKIDAEGGMVLYYLLIKLLNTNY